VTKKLVIASEAKQSRNRGYALMGWTAPERHRCARVRSLQISNEEAVRGQA
jgi:hypothetical protein